MKMVDVVIYCSGFIDDVLNKMEEIPQYSRGRLLLLLL
jgi:hypothetical protein